ncbi:MAG TPA: PAS domain S-box protein, partial [Deltaproteobacteria bacterium]|nr:PAS domain S-box protein [Deltaproteobacteria bacterium]
MSDKSIYQELKKRVRDLERAAARRHSDEGDIHEAAEKYRIHFSLANDVIYTIDRDFVVTSVSPSVERVLGYKPEELVGRSVAEVRVIPPSYLDKAMRETMQVLQGERIIGSTYEFITKDGQVKYGQVSGVPYMRDGRARAIISVARDITDLVEMERSLRESEERFRAIFESAQDCIFIKNLDLEYTFVNPCMERVLGLSSSEIIGKRDEELFADPPDFRTGKEDARVIAGEVVEGEYTRFLRGTVMTFHSIKVPMRDASGRITGLCGIARDITERKRFEEQLLAKERELAHQARFLEEMNITLKVLLDSREKEKKQAQEIIVSKARKIVYPYLEKLDACATDEEMRIYLNIIRSNLDELLLHGTDPGNPDTDDDGIGDGEEVLDLTSPVYARSPAHARS